jgi:diguanylate cyclase (GGDEF)-like protein/PAS domain S-box-containing protein
MTWQDITPSIVLWATAAIAALVARLTWQRKSVPGVIALFWLMLAATEWSLASGLEAAAQTLPLKIFFSRLEYLGSTSAAPFFLIFSLKYARQEKWLTRRNLSILWSIPILAVILVWTNDWHHLIWTGIIPNHLAGSNLFVYNHGMAFYFLIAYIYLCNAAATLVLLRTYLHTPEIYRRQIIVIITGALIPWFGSFIYVLNLTPVPGVDITPIFFMLSGLVLIWGIIHYHLFDIAPIARDILIESLRDGVMVLDDQDRIVDMNPAALLLLGFSHIPAGMNISELQRKWPGLVSILNKKPEKSAELSLSSNSGNFIEVRTTPIAGQKDRLSGYLITIQDITERKVIENKLEAQTHELERLAVTDELTGIFNRRYSNEVLKREFHRSERSGKPLAIALFDLDNLKTINDSFGHACGDEVLKAVAQEMTTNLRSSDLTARMGGDEFLVIFVDTDVNMACRSMERLCHRLAALDLTKLGGKDGLVTISGGVTGWFAGDTPDNALKRVDRLLYKAKKNGKDRILKK